MNQNWFNDSYYIKWVLEDENGLKWSEEYNEMSLNGFEVLYGNNSYKIIEIEMRLVNNEMGY